LLEGKNVNLRVMEKEDLPLYAEWDNNPEFYGELFAPVQRSRAEIEKSFSEPGLFEGKRFIIEKKDGTKIGWIVHFSMLHPMGKFLEIGYALAPNERGKGYCTEAAKIMVDYLFLSKEIACVQAIIDVRNTASQKVLENAGFQKEGTIRKRFSIRGEWRDGILYSILREEWKEPKILTKVA
jgi:RimJ/RimL family protein N-acetyltransferase